MILGRIWLLTIRRHNPNSFEQTLLARPCTYMRSRWMSMRYLRRLNWSNATLHFISMCETWWNMNIRTVSMNSRVKQVGRIGSWSYVFHIWEGICSSHVRVSKGSFLPHWVIYFLAGSDESKSLMECECLHCIGVEMCLTSQHEIDCREQEFYSLPNYLDLLTADGMVSICS